LWFNSFVIGIETKLKIGGKPFTLKQIVDATGNFSPENELGRGRSGIVYKVKKNSCS
jgi:hypothetical protein